MSLIRGELLPEFQPISYAPTHYAPTDPTFGAHLAAIDDALHITLESLGGLTEAEIGALIEAAGVGEDGEDGTDGQDGKSAYELAVVHGFVGTESEWLASLPGRDGLDGQAGQDGEDGAPGKSAYQLAVDAGFVGTQAQWLDSLNGRDGNDGQDGTNGTNGSNGVGVPTGGAVGQVLAKSGAGDYATAWVNPPTGSAAAEPWHGHAHAAYSGADAQALLERIYTEAGTNLTAAQVTASIVRMVRFYNPADLTVNCLRAICGAPFTAGAGLFRFALYNDALQKISDDIPMNTVAAAGNAWFQIGSSLNISLQAGKVYYLALAVATTNSSEPMRCFSVTNGLIYNAATPAELYGTRAMTFHTFNTTAGALPNTVTTFRAVERNLAGGFPAILLCNS